MQMWACRHPFCCYGVYAEGFEMSFTTPRNFLLLLLIFHLKRYSNLNGTIYCLQFLLQHVCVCVCVCVHDHNNHIATNALFGLALKHTTHVCHLQATTDRCR